MGYLPKMSLALSFRILTSSLWGLHVISWVMQLHNFNVVIEEEQPKNAIGGENLSFREDTLVTSL